MIQSLRLEFCKVGLKAINIVKIKGSSNNLFRNFFWVIKLTSRQIFLSYGSCVVYRVV